MTGMTAKDAERAAKDERERDRAVTDDAALVAYERKWAARVAKLQRAHPERWHVPGMSDEEVRDELTLRLVDAVRTKPEERARHRRPGKEWGLAFLVEQRRLLRRAHKLRVVVTDHQAALDRAECFARAPSEEERLIAGESASAVRLARARVEAGLTRPQRRWLTAMKETADAGGFFAASGALNLSAAARVLHKDRSSALRAFAELRSRFVRELYEQED